MLAKAPRLSAAAAYQLLQDTSSAPATADGGVKGVDACAAVVTLLHQGSCHSADVERQALQERDHRVALH
jgi:hypothetical protein